MLRAAIVGCGAICRMHAASIKQAGGLLVGAADCKKERADLLVSEYGGMAFDSLEILLDELKPDILHICTPHYLHIPMAKMALERNIHVLTEKPLALSDKDAAQLEHTLSITTASFGVCYQNRYVRPVVQAKELIATGELGRLGRIRSFVTWGRDSEYYTGSGWRGAWKTEGGGVMINQAVHTLDLMMYFAGSPELLGATTANHHLKGVIEVEDSAEIYMKFKNDVTGVMYATTAFGGDAPVLIDMFFENGTIRIEGDSMSVTHQNDGCAGKPPEIYSGKSCWGPGHAALIAEFYDCICSGRRFAGDYEQARKVCRVLDGVHKSNKTGELIVL